MFLVDALNLPKNRDAHARQSAPLPSGFAGRSHSHRSDTPFRLSTAAG